MVRREYILKVRNFSIVWLKRKLVLKEINEITFLQSAWSSDKENKELK